MEDISGQPSSFTANCRHIDMAQTQLIDAKDEIILPRLTQTISLTLQVAINLFANVT